MGACCGKGGSTIEVGEGFESAEVAFIWPAKEPQPSRVAYRSASIKALVKKFDEVKYEGGHRTRVVLPKGEYNSVWYIGNVKYVVPKIVAPTLLRKILESEAIKSKLATLGLDKIYNELLEKFKAGNDPQIADLPDGKFKDALVLVEGLLPINHFAVEPKITVWRGKFVNHERVMTTTEKLADDAAKIMAKPETQIAAARLKKKAAVEALKAAFNQLGIDLDKILGDVAGFFGVDPPKEHLDAQIADMNVDVLAPLTPEESKLLETGTPEFKSTAIARYCLATDQTRVPAHFEWRGPVEKGLVRLWQWSEGGKRGDQQVVGEFTGKKDKEGKEMPNTWETTVQLAPGRWALQWEVDGQVFWDNGSPIPADQKDACYKVLEVTAVRPIFT